MPRIDAEMLYAAYAHQAGADWSLPTVTETHTLAGVPEYGDLALTVDRALSLSERVSAEDGARRQMKPRYDAVVKAIQQALGQAFVDVIPTEIVLSPRYLDALRAYQAFYWGDEGNAIIAITNPCTGRACSITRQANGSATIREDATWIRSSGVAGDTPT